ncbi:MAG: LD-carboxypeptidase [Candidatus Magnetominusculus sp. LBB02]|nr:LD-carboxypeptidase [Candidatus Magnetominusculus sp. LBB02]
MTKLVLPQRLRHGDTIGLVSPSDPVTGKLHLDELEKGIHFLNNMGFNVELGKNVRSSEPWARAADINDFFVNKKISAIVSTQGGNSAELLLPYIRWDDIAANPKIFVGLSDATVTLNAIAKKTSMAVFHGSDVRYCFGKYPMKEVPSPENYGRQEFLDRLVGGKIGEVRKARPRKTVRGGKAEGRLIGGNLRCLLKIIKTDFCPDFQDAILILEALRITEDQCAAYFSELKSHGVFNQIKGVVVGFVYSMQVEFPDEPQMEDILCEFTDMYGFPILKANDFGHNTPNTVLPLGARVGMDADSKKFTILEPCVK